MKKILVRGLLIIGLLALLYFLIPFLWSSIQTGIKEMVFRFLVSYGFYILLLLFGGGFLWWKFRKFKSKIAKDEA